MDFAFDAFNKADDKGFKVTFKNGITVSCIFGLRAYSDYGATGCEVALIKKGDFISGYPHASEYDDVTGYITPEQLVDIMEWARAQA